MNESWLPQITMINFSILWKHFTILYRYHKNKHLSYVKIEISDLQSCLLLSSKMIQDFGGVRLEMKCQYNFTKNQMMEIMLITYLI